jgi:hypothetical protein
MAELEKVTAEPARSLTYPIIDQELVAELGRIARQMIAQRIAEVGCGDLLRPRTHPLGCADPACCCHEIYYRADERRTAGSGLARAHERQIAAVMRARRGSENLSASMRELLIRRHYLFGEPHPDDYCLPINEWDSVP